jgi:hypothetical protein
MSSEGKLYTADAVFNNVLIEQKNINAYPAKWRQVAVREMLCQVQPYGASLADGVVVL